MAEFEEMTVGELIRRLSDLDPMLLTRIAYDGGVLRETMKVYTAFHPDTIAIIEVPS